MVAIFVYMHQASQSDEYSQAWNSLSFESIDQNLTIIVGFDSGACVPVQMRLVYSTVLYSVCLELFTNIGALAYPCNIAQTKTHLWKIIFALK